MPDVFNNSSGTHRKPQILRVDFLDGIRGWASLIVLFAHIIGGVLSHETPWLNADSLSRFGSGFYWRPVYAIYGTLLRIFTDGRLAVLIFFVLSGYALSVSHFNTKKNTLALAATSRYFRLMIPIFFTSAIAYVMLKAGLFFNLDAAARNSALSVWLGSFYKFHATIGGLLSFSLYDVFFRYSGEDAYNSSLWTMPVELTGSFLIYGFLALFRRGSAIQWKIALLLTLALLWSAPLYACFTLGYLIAEFNKGLVEGAQSTGIDAFLVTIFFGVSIFSTFPQFRGGRGTITYDIVTCMIATAIVVSVSFSTTLRGFFSNKLSKFLGRISFPLYLVQIIVICSWSSYLFLKVPLLARSSLLASVLNLGTSVSICIGLGVLLLPVERFSVFISKRLGCFLLVRSEELFSSQESHPSVASSGGVRATLTLPVIPKSES